MTKENIPEYSVTELSTALKNTIEDKFGYVRIKGELSGINNHSSGHIYLTLKDENAVINGIIWRSSVAKLKIRPEEGLEVICTGKISTGYNPGRYAGRSNYQITIDTMKPAGVGALMAILEERKEKLKSEGLFEIHHKKSIPKYPSTIGVITSPTGAVLQDIKHPTAEIRGMLLSKTARTILSSLKHHRSSILPPPLAKIKTSGFEIFEVLSILLNPRIAFSINSAASFP